MESTQRRAELDRTVIAALAQSPTISDALRNLLEAIAQYLQYLNCEFGAIWQTDETNTRLRSFATWESPTSDLDAFRRETQEIELESGRGLPVECGKAASPPGSWTYSKTTTFLVVRPQHAAAFGERLRFRSWDRTGWRRWLSSSPASRSRRTTASCRRWRRSAFRPVSTWRECESRRGLRWLAAVVESSEDAIVTARFNGEIVSWNKAAEKLYGWRADEIIGWISLGADAGGVYRGERAARHARPSGQAVENHETVRKRKDGSLIDVALSISPYSTRTATSLGPPGSRET